MHFLLSILISIASLNTLTTCRNIFFHLICCSLLLPFLKPGYISLILISLIFLATILSPIQENITWFLHSVWYEPRIDLQSSDNSLYESVFVEILRTHDKNIIVGCLYRPPDSSLNDFNRSDEDILSATSFENKLSYIMGDFNINILNSHSHQPTNEFINLMTSNSLYPLISKPTRMTSSTATLIDNIFTNNLELHMNSSKPLFSKLNILSLHSLFINFMFLVLYSHTLIAFYLPLFSLSFLAPPL